MGHFEPTYGETITPTRHRLARCIARRAIGVVSYFYGTAPLFRRRRAGDGLLRY